MRYLPALAIVAACGPYPDYPPQIFSAQALCYYDSFNRDYIWDFEVGVDDRNGPYDVVEVYADVYDVRGEPVLLDSFELFPTAYATVWWSDWLERSTPLFCGYEFYAVDLWAYDRAGLSDGVTVIPRY